jgi:hypothetical protein
MNNSILAMSNWHTLSNHSAQTANAVADEKISMKELQKLFYCIFQITFNGITLGL